MLYEQHENHNRKMSVIAQQNVIMRDGKQYREIKEGLARILVPADAPTQVDPRAAKAGEGQPNAPTVFYNPIQQFNRDLSVLAIRAFGEDLLAVRRTRKKQRPPKRKAGGAVDKTEEGEGEIDGAGGVPAEKRAKTEYVQEETAHVQDGDASTTTNGATLLETSTNNETTATTAPPATNPPRTPKFKILDALSATGLRALRYAHEIPFASSITAVDLSAEATASIAANVAHNALVPKINIITGNALSHMYTFAGTETGPPTHTVSKKYDVIDLDPYGTAAPFLDAAVQAVADGGLLCVTCTDAGVWASCGYPEKTYALYGGTPVKGLHSHEAGLRLILHAIAAAAARYGVAVEPLLSLSIDFYARVFVRVKQSPAEVKMLAGKTMLVYGCDGGCGAWTTQPLARHQPATNKDGSTRWQHGLAQAPVAGPYCGFCGFKTHVSGAWTCLRESQSLTVFHAVVRTNVGRAAAQRGVYRADPELPAAPRRLHVRDKGAHRGHALDGPRRDHSLQRPRSRHSRHDANSRTAIIGPSRGTRHDQTLQNSHQTHPTTRPSPHRPASLLLHPLCAGKSASLPGAL